MILDNYNKMEDKIVSIETKRLMRLGYTEKDAHEIAIDSIDTKMMKLLIFEIWREVKKNK